MKYFTQEELKEIIIYDPILGDFKRKVMRGGESILETTGSINDSGHLIITVKGRTYSAARLVWFYMTGETVPSNKVVSYKNKNRDDLSYNNLFITSRSRSIAGRTRRVKDITQRKERLPTGVLKSRLGKFYTRFTINKRCYQSEYFDTIEEARDVYISINEEYRTKGTFDIRKLIKRR